MGCICVTVKQVNGSGVTMLECFIDFFIDHDRSHGDSTAGEPFGAGDHIRDHIKIMGGEWCSQASKSRDHFIKNEENIMFITDLPNSF